MRELGRVVVGVVLSLALLVACTPASPSTDAEAARETKPVELGEWTLHGSDGGASAVFAGDRTIALGRGHAVVWQGDTRVGSFETMAASPGRGRAFGERVVWGPNLLDLDTNTLELRAAAVPEPMPMDQGDVAQAYAWSGEGEWLVRSTSRIRSGFEVTLHRGSNGERAATLHRSTGVAPQALWVGRAWLVLGLSPPEVVDFEGHRVATIELDEGSLARLEANADERWLMAVALNRTIALIDTASWKVVGRWPGRWADASITPKGHAVVGLELDGTLRVARTSAAGLEELETLATIERGASVQVSDDTIAVVGGGELRQASLRVR